MENTFKPKHNNDKVYQLLAQDRWFSPGTPPSSNTKTGRHGNISDSDVKYQRHGTFYDIMLF
jgi:hypothetical protein